MKLWVNEKPFQTSPSALYMKLSILGLKVVEILFQLSGVALSESSCRNGNAHRDDNSSLFY